MKNKIKSWWLNLDEAKREKIISAADTFISTFFMCIVVTLESGINWSWTFWGATLGMALRTAIKSLRQKYAPESLGGIRK